MGVILNRPTQYNMGYVSGQSDGPFAENALYFGGDVGDGTVSFLHGSDKVQGSAEVLPGVYLGGYDSACELVKKEEDLKVESEKIAIEKEEAEAAEKAARAEKAAAAEQVLRDDRESVEADEEFDEDEPCFP